jgi:catechol 2,3-dioxygenase-like lactoylglutathione lyase family enzyme
LSDSVHSEAPAQSIGTENLPIEGGQSLPRVSGVHHVAIGVRDLETMTAFYRDLMGFTEVFAEFGESEQEIMREVTRSSRAVFSGATLQQKAGGIMLEFIQMREPAPRPIHRNVRYGDIGVTKITIATADVPSVWGKLRDRVDFRSEPKTTVIAERGDYQFVYCRDPEGNLVEIASGNPGAEQMFGGACSVGIGVSDLERSVPFYRDFLGFDVTLADAHESFSGLVDEVSGTAGTRVRSCLLSANAHGEAMIELFETLRPRGRSIPFSTCWGDFGYLQAAFNCDDVHGVATDLEAAGVELLCSPKVLDGGPMEHPGEFVYARDPDGIPIEFLFVPE